MKKYLLATTIIAVLFGCGTENTRPKEPSSLEKKPQNIPYNRFFDNLESRKIAPGKSIYLGAYVGSGKNESSLTQNDITDFETKVSHPLTFVTTSNVWGKKIEYPKDSIHLIANSGKIPIVRMLPRSDSGENETSEDKLYPLGSIISGKFDNDLKEWAHFAKQDNIPLMVDFAPEPNGFWFPWSGLYAGGAKTDGYGDPKYPDGPERYRDAYRHIIDLFRQEGVKNITWVFHPDIQRLPNLKWNSTKYYYPGDNYIDWVGLSIYGKQFKDEDYITFEQSILFEDNSEEAPLCKDENLNCYDKKSRLDILHETTQTKPYALLEFAMAQYPKKEEWIGGTMKNILTHSPIYFSLINYWNERWVNADGSISDLRIDSSNQSLSIFRDYLKREIFDPKDVVFNKKENNQ